MSGLAWHRQDHGCEVSMGKPSKSQQYPLAWMEIQNLRRRAPIDLWISALFCTRFALPAQLQAYSWSSRSPHTSRITKTWIIGEDGGVASNTAHTVSHRSGNERCDGSEVLSLVLFQTPSKQAERGMNFCVQ